MALLWIRDVDVENKSFSSSHIDVIVMDPISRFKWRMTGFYRILEKSFPTLPHMHQVKDVSLAIVVLIVDFVIPEKYNVPIREQVVPMSSWFQASKKRKDTQSQAFYPISKILFRRPKIVLLQHFKTQGRVFSNQKRMMRTWKSSRKKKIKYTKIQELWSSFDVRPSSHL